VTQGTHPLTDAQYAQYPGNITFTLNGKSIYSARVTSSPSTVSFSYTPTSTGSGELTAIVSDSVLYSGSQTVAMGYNVAATPAPQQTQPDTTNTTPPTTNSGH
jgi:hypothetical protein